MKSALFCAGSDLKWDSLANCAIGFPGLSQLMDDARARKLDVVLCWKLDRFGRSLLDCPANLRELDSHGVRFIATTQGLDTDNPLDVAWKESGFGIPASRAGSRSRV
jgi:Site-specific recombinases, DNA invertase Pin homologs